MIVSGGSVVLVDHAAEASSASDGGVHGDDDGRIVVGRQLLTPLMGTMIVEVVEVLADHGPRVAFVVDQDVIEALLAETAAEALDETVRPRRPRRRLDHPDARRVARGIAAPGSHRTERDSLPSFRSSHPSVRNRSSRTSARTGWVLVERGPATIAWLS